MADKKNKPVNKDAADYAQRKYNERPDSFSWASSVIEELRKRGFTTNQQKNILYHLLAESDGMPTRVQGDWSPTYTGDDGSFRRGRGLVQLTGYDNYRRMEEETGIPLTKNPKLAALPEYAPIIAAAYYKTRQKDYKNLDFDNPEHVHRATGPKETWTERVSRLSSSGYRFPNDDDVNTNTPAYDASKYIAEDNGSLTAKLLPELKRMSTIDKTGITPNTTPTSR